MRSTQFLWVAFLLAVVLPAPAAAQEAAPPPTPVDSLARVRVQQRYAVPRRVTGAIVAADTQSATVRPPGDPFEVIVPFAEMEWMEVSLGPRTRGEGLRRGAVRGFLGGAAVSAALVVAGLAAGGDCGDCFITPAGIAAIVAVPITGTTTVGGVVLGAAAPGEHWVRAGIPVALRPPRV